MKVNRIISVLMFLLKGDNKINAQELAKICGASMNTIYRDIETLRKAGIPVVGAAGHYGGISIPDEFKLEKKIFSYPDMSAAALALIEEYPGILNIDSYVLAKHRLELSEREQKNSGNKKKAAVIKVTLRLNKSYKTDLEKQYDLDIVSLDENGFYEACIYIEADEAEYRRLLSFGDICKCTEPRHVRDYIKNKVDAMFINYSD